MLAAIAPASLRRVNGLRRVAPLPEWKERAPLLVLWDSLVPQSRARAGPLWSSSRFLSSGKGDGSGKDSKEAEGALLEGAREEEALKEESLENDASGESGKTTEASGELKFL